MHVLHMYAPPSGTTLLMNEKHFLHLGHERAAVVTDPGNDHWGPMQQPSELRPCFLCFPCFESWHGPCSTVKRRTNLVKSHSHLHSKKRKMVALPVANMTFLTFVCPSCKASLVELFHHHSHLCAKIGALRSWCI